MVKKYKIRVKTLESRILTFNNVVDFVVKDGMGYFTDSKENIKLVFPLSSIEMQEVE
jgi:hypothetical protein